MITTIIFMVALVVFIGWFGTRNKAEKKNVLNPELLRLARLNRQYKMVNIYES